MSSFKMRNLQSESELEKIIMETKDSNVESKLDVNKIEKMKIRELREQWSKLYLNTARKKAKLQKLKQYIEYIENRQEDNEKVECEEEESECQNSIQKKIEAKCEVFSR